jgi:hypothetical protein
LSVLDMMCSFKVDVVILFRLAPFLATEINLAFEAQRNPLTRPCVTLPLGTYGPM